MENSTHGSHVKLHEYFCCEGLKTNNVSTTVGILTQKRIAVVHEHINMSKFLMCALCMEEVETFFFLIKG
jgi:hypothetical protein